MPNASEPPAPATTPSSPSEPSAGLCCSSPPSAPATPPSLGPPPSAPPAPPPCLPPPLIAPPPLARARPGRGWKILSLILFLLLAGLSFLYLQSFLGDFGLGGTMGHTAGPHFLELLLEDNDSQHKLVIVDVNGIIYSGPADGSGLSLAELIAAQLKRAAREEKVKAVVLKVDSPGGEVLASDDIYRAIEKFQNESHKPVVASMGSLAASGGYYVAAPCRWIVAHELTITGSIGVIMHTWNYRGLMNKVGLRPEVFKSGKFKDMLSGERDLDALSPEEKDLYRQERVMVQGLVDETFAKFKSVVRRGREQAGLHRKDGREGRRLVDDWANYADGRVLSGKQALDLGFVDELGTFHDAVKRAKQLAKIDDANLVQYQIPFDLANLFRLFGKTEAPAVKIELGWDLPKLQAGRLYFLSPTVLH